MNISLVAMREYRERVAKKSFIVVTLLFPIFMAAMMVLPGLLMVFSSPRERTIAISDASGLMGPQIAAGAGQLPAELHLVVTQLPADSLIGSPEQYEAVLEVPADVVTRPRATLLTHEASSMDVERELSRLVQKAVEQRRLDDMGYAELPRIMEKARADVSLQTIRLDAEREGAEASSTLSFILGLAMSMLLYMVVIMYGQVVMSSIIEEKSTRVLDVLVTSVRPFDLMMGKIMGIGWVAVTQIVIWGVLLTAVSAFLVPLLAPEMLAGDSMQAQAMMQTLGNPGHIAALMGWLLVFLVGGFLLYASIYAAIGASVDNMQDGSQMQSIVLVPLIAATMFDVVIAQDPDTTLGMWLTFVPFTSPMIALARLPYGIPVWQPIVAAVILYATALLTTLLAAKIYRIGIFVHGAPRPSLAKLGRWLRS